ncbi:7,8-dihydroneopterin aldolase [Parapedobacter pyrenivorans]|uniref:7,8-dihydroneopterin aldolase n=1 Tax=Parapedobacter pyrenivorans TaxID=1305674 RepID=A0A917MD67_9SPHI|nr:dihydroneopterin aldolase [Parapedobacter pyrenivorans]GGG97773.1 7,8-dihydroneopterin aldolase [Parapedobacter pyrenivorans]
MRTIRQHITLTDLRFYAFHGYYPEEQVLGNEFIVSIHVAFYKRGKAEEDLSGTVNYETLYGIAKEEMQCPRKLLETVTETMLDRVLAEFPFVDEIEVNICKNNPPFGADHAKANVALVWKLSEDTASGRLGA